MPATDRAAFIAGLRDLADFLEANPAVPIPRHTISVDYFPKRVTDAEMRAEVDHVAGLLGTSINTASLAHHHYSTGLNFGPVRYEATAILAAARAKHEAETSYQGCVQPDTNTPDIYAHDDSTANAPAHAA